jgi:hypothetical protein
MSSGLRLRADPPPLRSVRESPLGPCRRGGSRAWTLRRGSGGRRSTRRSVRSAERQPGGLRGVVGEDADDVRAAPDFTVDALKRLVERSLDQCSGGNAMNASRSSSACSSSWQIFGAIDAKRARTSVRRRLASARSVALKTSRRAAETRPRWAGRQWPCMLRTKWTVQRCHGASRTRAIAVWRPF